MSYYALSITISFRMMPNQISFTLQLKLLFYYLSYCDIFHSTIGWERMRSRMLVSENSFSGE